MISVSRSNTRCANPCVLCLLPRRNPARADAGSSCSIVYVDCSSISIVVIKLINRVIVIIVVIIIIIKTSQSGERKLSYGR